MNYSMLCLICGWAVCFDVLNAFPAAPPTDDLQSDSAVKLPDPPPRIADAAVQAQTCLECHEEMKDLLAGDKHIAADFHCVVCHGPSKKHVEMEVEGTLPDRVWRRWDEEKNAYTWRMEKASLQIARFCASCHAREPAEGDQIKTIDWDDYLDTGHGLGVAEGSHDAAACTDCHYAHGAGCEPMTDEAIIQRCSLCHSDQEMMKRAGVDPRVMGDFKAGTHGKMNMASPEKKSTCIKCHEPH